MAKAKPVPGVDSREPLLVNAARMITARLDEMLAYERYLENADEVYELHQMRIAAKRLRYTMELFQDIYTNYTAYGKAFSEAIEVVKGLQETLGDLHDADVLTPQLTQQLARLLKDGYGKNDKGEPVVGVHHVDFDACAGLLTLCRDTRAARDRRFKQLTATWRQLQSEHTFQNLRALLAAAISTPQAKPLQETAFEPSRAVLQDRRSTDEEDAAHGEDTKNADTARSQTDSSRRARKSAGRNVATNTVRHSRARPHPGQGFAEGGTE